MRGFVGLLIGVPLGAGAMYLVLRPPWAGHGGATVTDAGGVVAAPNDAGKPKKKPASGNSGHHVHHQPTPGAGTDEPTTDGEETEPPAPVLTAADRALEWRGDDVVLPPQKIDLNGGAEARSLDNGEIDSGIAGGGGFKDCVVQGATNTDLRATITVKLLVDGNGRVTRTRVQAPHYLQEHGLLGCTQRAAARLHFAATGGFTIVTLPVNLG